MSGFDAGSIIAHVKADVTGFKKGIDEAQDKANNFSKGLDQVAGMGKKVAIGLAVAGAGAVAFGVSSVKAYEEAETAQKQLEHAVINVTHATQEQLKETENLAGVLMKKGVLDDDAIKVGLAQLSTFGLSNKAVQQLGGSLADLAVNQFGVSASGEQLSDTANMIAKALNGQFGILEKSGIRFTQAQKDIIQYGSEMQKVDAINQGFAQNLKFTNEVALTTTEGKLAKAKVAVGNFKEAIGQTIIEALGPLAIKLGDIAASESFQTALKKMIVVVTDLVTWIGKGIIILVELGTWLEHHKVIAAALAGIIMTVLVVAFVAWAVAAGTAAIATIAATWPILAIGAAIGAVAYLIISHWETIKHAFGAAKDFIIHNIELFMFPWLLIVPRIREALAGVWDAITGPFQRAFDWLHGALDKVKGALNKLNPFAHFSPSLYELVSAGTSAIKDKYADMFGTVGDLAQKFTAVNLAPAIVPQASNSVNTAIYGNISIGSEVDANNFMARLTSNQQLAMKGITPQ